MTFELGPGEIISGAVAWRSGQPVGANVLVCAWLDGHEPEWEALRRAARGHPSASLHHAVTNDEGQFELVGLAMGKSYSLTAAGEGGIPREPLVKVVAGVSRPTVVLLPLYAAFVHLREPNDEPLRTSSRVYGTGPYWDYAHAESLRSVPRELAMLSLPELNGVAVGTNGNTPRNDRLVLFLPDEHVQEIGPVSYFGEVPGYEPFRTQFFLSPVASQGVVHHFVELQLRTDFWGSVEVRCKGSGINLAPSSGHARWLGKIRMRDESGRNCEVAIHKPIDGAAELLSGIPSGRYDVWFEGHDWYQRLPDDGESWKIEIGPLVPTPSLSLDFSGVGVLHVRLFEADGSEYTGYACLDLQQHLQAERWITNNVTFEEAPYVFQGLYPDEYRVKIASIPGLRRGAQRSASATVWGDEIATADLDLVR